MSNEKNHKTPLERYLEQPESEAVKAAQEKCERTRAENFCRLAELATPKKVE